MRKEERLSKRAQFAAVYDQGNSWVNHFLVLRALANGLEHNRYGFVVSKKVGEAATRNRVRRLLREAARMTPTKKGWDVVFIARKPCSVSNYHQLAEALAGLLRRAQLLQET